MTQPWYMPALWPLGHVGSALQKDQEPAELKATASLDLWGTLTSFAASARSFLLAYLAVHVAYAEGGYPAFGAAKEWSLAWMWPILMRNLLATWCICGFWDWFLYMSPMKEALRRFKMNPKYPPFSQIRHDAVATTVATLCATAVEVLMCHLWATGRLPMQRSLAETPLRNFVMALTITHWRVPHFYLMHRAFHPWRTTRVPDLGKVLYRYVHAQHHKSYIPTAFGGTNMHVVEATCYYGQPALFTAFFARLHPAMALACMFDCAVGAWLGHDGFRWPGSGDYFHQLHHEHFDCNYGAQHIPLDQWMGTYCGSKADLKKVWGNQKVGREANLSDTKIWDCK
mmetsp:Transcript_119809/g.284669  ORF Transcript_119809/g.284669 Transcript_119809/m.284669 type:complete len:341 (-) Transcript_119809:44-1066(-)